MLRFVCCLLFLVASPRLFSQTQQSIFDYDIKQWTQADGLSNNSVRAISQDSQGYLWVGTLTGLNRFDGQQFTLFTSNTTRRQLVSNVITKLYTDKTGYLWIGTATGLSGVNPATLKFDRYNILGEVTALVEVSDHELWVAADNLFRVRDGVVSRVDDIKETVSQVLAGPDAIWVTTARFIYRIPHYGAIEKIPLTAELAQHPIYDLVWSGDSLHFATEQGYYHLDSDLRIHRCQLPITTDGAVYQLLHDSDGADWVSTYNNLFHRHRDQSWQIVNKDALGTSTQFMDIFEDQQHNVWLASFSDGLYRASRGNIKRVVGEGQQDIVVRSVITTPDDQLVVATSSQLGILDEQWQFKPLPVKSGGHFPVVQDIEFTDDGWYLATDSGFYRYKDQQLETIAPALAWTKIKSVVARREGGYWLGTGEGLYQFQLPDQLKPFPLNNELESNAITFLDERAERLLIGTTRGAYQYRGQRLTRLGLGSNLYGAFITSMLTLKDGRLLVGTADDGLFVVQADKHILQFDSTNGLPFEPVVSMYQDESTGYVWVSTLKGIFRFLPERLTSLIDGNHAFEEILSPYERQLGTAPGRCCNGAGASKVANWRQQLWYPTLKGIVGVPLDLKSASSARYRPLVAEVVTEQTYQLQPEQTRLVLEVNERDVTIRYTAIDFLRPQALEFRYQLQGFDNDWRTVGNRREAIYTNLPPGQYQFVLQSRNQNQNWEMAEQTAVELVVPRRFDETMVYRGLWLVFGLLGLAGIVWLARRNTVRREVELTRLVRQRTIELETTNLRLNEANEELSLHTQKDPLTGLRNRRFLFEQLPKDIEHYQRNRDSMLAQNKCLALMHLDIDGFKAINDKHGNNAGDMVLQQISSLLIRETRGSDYVVRYGGDEFLLVLRDVPMDLVTEFAERLNELLAIENFLLPNGSSASLRVAIGYSIYPLDLLGGQLISWEISLRLAELALLHIKQNGGNAVAAIQFDRHVDAFEFEDSQHIERQVEKFLADGVAWFAMQSGKVKAPAFI